MGYKCGHLSIILYFWKYWKWTHLPSGFGSCASSDDRFRATGWEFRILGTWRSSALGADGEFHEALHLLQVVRLELADPDGDAANGAARGVSPMLLSAWNIKGKFVVVNFRIIHSTGSTKIYSRVFVRDITSEFSARAVDENFNIKIIGEQ